MARGGVGESDMHRMIAKNGAREMPVYEPGSQSHTLRNETISRGLARGREYQRVAVLGKTCDLLEATRDGARRSVSRELLDRVRNRPKSILT